MRVGVEVDRLLAEHRLAGLAACSMKSAWVSVGVPISIASIVLSRDDLVERPRPARRSPPAAPWRRPVSASAIADQLRPRRGGDVPAVDLADAAGAEQPESKHVAFLPRMLILKQNEYSDIDCQLEFMFHSHLKRQPSALSNGIRERRMPEARAMPAAARSTSSPSAAPRSTSTASRSARGWRTSPPSPSRSAAARPTSPSARRGSA